MNISRITVRYAKALLEISVSKDIASSVNDDMKMIMNMADLKDFKLFLENPSIQISRKNKVLNDIFKNKVNPLTLNFLLLLTKNKREIYLKSIARNFIHKYRQLFGITHVTLTTTVMPEEKFLNEIEQSISKKFNTKVELTDIYDESLIGGFIIKIDDKQYDASVKNKLEKIKRELLSAN